MISYLNSTHIKNHIYSLAIGRFNGFHLGHQTLFRNLIGNGGIMMIERESKEYILPREYSYRFIDLPIFKYNLNSVRELSGEEFVKKISEEFPNLKRIVVGYDFRFAKNRDSSALDLSKLSNCEVFIVDEVLIEGISVHSAEIVKRIRCGEIEIANKLLGRNYLIIGHQIKGQGLGNKSLLPTININIGSFTKPMAGSYFSTTIINNYRFSSVTFVGVRSTDGIETVETHLIDFNYDEEKNIKFNFNDEVQIEFIKFIRARELFNNLEDLKKSIIGDIKFARNYL